MPKDLRFLKAIVLDKGEGAAIPCILPSFYSLLLLPLAEVEDMSLVLGTLIGPRNSQPRILTRASNPVALKQ